MIKKTLITIFFCILLINIVSAEELTLLDTEYNAGETLQAFVTNTSISTSQISLMDNSSNLVSITPLISEFREDQYLIYFNLNSDLLGDYKLIVKSMVANFTVSSTDFALQVKPGIIVLDENEESFKLELTNSGEPITVQISSTDSEISPRKSALSMTYEETRNLYSDYTYSSISSDSEITLSYGSGTYSIPIIFSGELAQEEIINETIEETNITETNITIEEEIVEEEVTEALSFITTKDKAEIPLTPEESFEGYLNFINNLNESIYNLEFSLTGNLDEVLELNITSIEEIKAGETQSQYIWANKNKSSEPGVYSGELILSNELYSASLEIEITIEGEEEEEIVEEEEVVETQDPIVLDESQLNYPTQEEGMSGTTVIGIIMIIILLGIFILIFMKMRQKNEKKFNQYIQETKRK